MLPSLTGTLQPEEEFVSPNICLVERKHEYTVKAIRRLAEVSTDDS